MKTEADTRAEYIDPMLMAAAWGHNLTEGSKILREHYFTDGRMLSGGQRGRRKFADYILVHKNQKLAIVEAKKESEGATEGLEQVKDYARLLNIRIVYATNGKETYFFDMETGRGEYVEQYHTPDDLYRLVNGEQADIVERAITEPFHKTKYDPRYYQENAIQTAVRAIAAGDDRVLLTLATGTGKTFISFQIVWKLFNAKWNKRGDGRRPRIMFLADRNVLIEQAMGDFNPLEDEIVRVDGDAVRNQNGVPTNANIFFSIYQAMTGGGDTPYYKDYPEDFFDLIIIDECHRGAAGDESRWKDVLKHFKAATQLGLTATPKRDKNTDTYDYFGDPRYTYSLRDGIEDGFLTPFKVKKVSTTMDAWSYAPGDIVLEGEVEKERYEKEEMNRSIIIPEREEAHVKIMLREIDQSQKTIVFCMNEAHALLVRDLINKHKTSNDADYCVRVTASEGAIGDQWLRVFRDNEKTIPTILTTSQKLSTGVDARNLRYVVLMRPVGSMVEFKQIVGRGTRVYENKDHFTIVDFYDNYEKFDDPDWDGEPAEIEPVIEGEEHEDSEKPTKEKTLKETLDDVMNEEVGQKQSKKIKIKLSDTRAIEIDSMVETFYFGSDGKRVSAEQFIKDLFNRMPEFFSDEEALRTIWSHQKTRDDLIDQLAQRGFDMDKLLTLREAFKAEDSDIYDLLRFIAFDKEIISRGQRVGVADMSFVGTDNEQLSEFINFVLLQYEQNGFEAFNDLAALIATKYGSNSVVTEMGGVEKVRTNFDLLQEAVYRS
jgi:type I restriction enzyme R subunit